MDAFQCMMRAASQMASGAAAHDKGQARGSRKRQNQSKAADQKTPAAVGAACKTLTQHAQHGARNDSAFLQPHLNAAQAVQSPHAHGYQKQGQQGPTLPAGGASYADEPSAKRAHVALSNPATAPQQAVGAGRRPAWDTQQEQCMQIAVDTQGPGEPVMQPSISHEGTTPRHELPYPHAQHEHMQSHVPGKVWDVGDSSRWDGVQDQDGGCETWEEWGEEGGEGSSWGDEGVGDEEGNGCETIRIYAPAPHLLEAMLLQEGDEQAGEQDLQAAGQEQGVEGTALQLPPQAAPSPHLPAGDDAASIRTAGEPQGEHMGALVDPSLACAAQQGMTAVRSAGTPSTSSFTAPSTEPLSGPRHRVRSWHHAARPFAYLAVLDMEATCNAARNWAPVEVIEVACVVVRLQNLALVGEFQRHVRPTERPVLDPFCTHLTGISQAQVDGAQPLMQVLPELDAWLSQTCEGVGPEGVLPVTWSSWDLQVCLPTECKWRNLAVPRALRRWCDLRKTYARAYKPGHNLRSSVEAAGLIWEGRPHCGLDDARNTASLTVHLIRDKGIALKVTAAFDDAPVAPGAGRTLKQMRLQGPSRGGATGGRKTHDAQGAWNGQCGCGVPAALRTTKKPGPHLGRAFYSCGRWRILEQKGTCTFFKWADEVAVPPKGI